MLSPLGRGGASGAAVRPSERSRQASRCREEGGSRPDLAQQAIDADRGLRERAAKPRCDFLSVRRAESLHQQAPLDPAVAAAQALFFRYREVAAARGLPDL